MFCGLSLSACGVLPSVTGSAGAPTPPRVWMASELPSQTPATPSEVVVPTMVSASSVNASPETPAQPYGVSVAADQCWAQMVIYPRKEILTQQVITKDGRLGYDVQPPVLKTLEESVTVRDGALSFKVEPPQYKEIVEQVKVKDEIKKFVVEPAVYSDEKDTVMIESPRVEMRSCRSAGKRIVGPRQPMASQTQCAVSIPAKYKTITRKVLTKPEVVTEVITPAVYQTIVKWALVENGKALSIEIPAEKVQKQVVTVDTPAQAVPLSIPPHVKEFDVTNYESAPQLAWRQVVCAKDSSPSMVEDLQFALKREGLEFGPVDGKLGKRTMKAVESYQLRKGIASGFLTYETMDMMGLQQTKK